MTTQPVIVYRVAGDTKPAKLAGAITAAIRDGRGVAILAIGAGAVNQGIKALAIARGFVAADGFDLAGLPSMVDHRVGGSDRTAVRLDVWPVPLVQAAA